MFDNAQKGHDSDCYRKHMDLEFMGRQAVCLGRIKMKNSQGIELQYGVMQESMLTIHEQIHKILDETNLHERKRLMQEHQLRIHQHIKAHERRGLVGQ